MRVCVCVCKYATRVRETVSLYIRSPKAHYALHPSVLRVRSSQPPPPPMQLPPSLPPPSLPGPRTCDAYRRSTSRSDNSSRSRCRSHTRNA